MEIIHPITGRKLSIESFHFDRTYASLVYGSPNLRINTGIIERANERLCYFQDIFYTISRF